VEQSRGHIEAGKEVYDYRYSVGYREHLSGYEIARWHSLKHFLTGVLSINDAKMVLDYGAGSGLHVKLWEKIFHESSLHFCDISSVARKKFIHKNPSYANSYRLVSGGRADFDDSSFDVVVSVEVMEHVIELTEYLKDIYRLLRPGGRFVWTTPCANEFSIEHVIACLTGKVEKTNEGYRRWRWEDPTHLRRLRSQEITRVLQEYGFEEVLFRFRSHFFSYLCTHCHPISRFTSLANKLMSLDYSLFRRLPNGASMLGCARLPA
jgi:ubiquinone/menaquinone biosynthesis C-methylase UbiE